MPTRASPVLSLEWTGRKSAPTVWGCLNSPRCFGLTSDPNIAILGSNGYPRNPRTPRTPAGYTRPADPPYADLWTPARTGRRPRHPADIGRGAACGARCALSRAPETRREELDLCLVG